MIFEAVASTTAVICYSLILSEGELSVVYMWVSNTVLVEYNDRQRVVKKWIGH